MLIIRGVMGQLGDEIIIHKETKLDSKGRLVYEFEKTRVGTNKMNIKNKTHYRSTLVECMFLHTNRGDLLFRDYQ